MLLVILGAGASYDSDPDRVPRRCDDKDEYRPPLTDQLFNDRGIFIDVRNRYPKINDIIPFLRNRPDNVSFEERLYELQTNENDDRQSQLAALRYYLSEILDRCESDWIKEELRTTNHRALFDAIESFVPEEEVCLVTFNYDTLIELSLSRRFKLSFNLLTKYVSGSKYKVFKLHGSKNWGRVVSDCPGLGMIEDRDSGKIPDLLISNASKLSLSNEFQIKNHVPVKNHKGYALFPAIAIPVQQGKTFHECPSAHVSELKKCIPKITKILIVGWSATELHFLSL